MSRKVISVDAFVMVYPGTEEVLNDGRTEVAYFGFDPRTCAISVDENGILSVEQEGLRMQLLCPPQLWRRV